MNLNIVEYGGEGKPLVCFYKAELGTPRFRREFETRDTSYVYRYWSSMHKVAAVIFDLDGVLTDTAEFHYQSWQWLMDELGIPFDRQKNEALRGLSRAESLAAILGEQSGKYTETQKTEILRRKNDNYVERVEKMSPSDMLPGAGELLDELHARNIPIAVASSSKNAEAVLARLGIRARFAALVDGNDVPDSKPNPRVFQEAARRLNVTPRNCVVVEDAASGIAAARAAGMRVIGVGPSARVGRAHVVKASIAEVTPELLLEPFDE